MFVTASKDCTIRVWHRDTGDCILCHTDVSVGDAYTSLAVLPPSRVEAVGDDAGGSFVHLIATTIRARVLVYALRLDLSKLVCVAACASPSTTSATVGSAA